MIYTTITDNYILITSDEEIKEGDYCTSDKNIIDEGKIHNSYTLFKIMSEEDKNLLKSCKKVIAYLPLGQAPKLEGVTLLPPLPSGEDDVEKLVNEIFTDSHPNHSEYEEGLHIGFKKGYNKAKEKYSLSNIIGLYIEETGYGMDMWSKEENEVMTTIAKIIQSLLQPKNMPIGFKCEYVPMTPSKFTLEDHLEVRPKIINGVMQGEWIFE